MLGIDGRETGTLSLDPLAGVVSREESRRAVEDLEEPLRLPLPVSQQRFERGLDRRIRVLRKDDAPPGFFEVVGIDVGDGEVLGRSLFAAVANLLPVRIDPVEIGFGQARQWRPRIRLDPEGNREFIGSECRVGTSRYIGRHRSASYTSAACQIACATSGPSMSECAPDTPPPLAMNRDDSRL